MRQFVVPSIFMILYNCTEQHADNENLNHRSIYYRDYVLTGGVEASKLFWSRCVDGKSTED